MLKVFKVTPESICELIQNVLIINQFECVLDVIWVDSDVIPDLFYVWISSILKTSDDIKNDFWRHSAIFENH